MRVRGVDRRVRGETEAVLVTSCEEACTAGAANRERDVAIGEFDAIGSQLV